jgi:WhiB family redox-sensing transcriptional regulator
MIAIEQNLNWKKESACKDANTNLFFPENGKPPAREALDMCDSCSVSRECLEYALSDPSTQGVWAGTTENFRRKIRRQNMKDGSHSLQLLTSTARYCLNCGDRFNAISSRARYCSKNCGERAEYKRRRKVS